jgi:cell division protein FtsW
MRQGIFAVGGLALLVIAAFVKSGVYRKLSGILLILGICLQMLVHVPGLGYEVGGNRNWIRVPGTSMTLQPSEMLKLALAVWLGAFLAARHKVLHQVKRLVPAVVVVVVSLGLVLWGKDLGTMMVMALLVAGSLWVAGLPKRWFGLGLAVGTAGVLTMALTSANRMARITAWLHGTCTGSTCDQPEQGRMALATGGWWGLGLGHSRQKWGRLPAAEDDYIFAIIGEELGLVGTLGVVLMFSLLALILFRMIQRARDPFIQITVAGVTCWLIGQALVNMMVVTGLLPVLGVPLPFISSGGSALLASMLALGMLISFAREEPGAVDAISARWSSVRGSVAVLPASRADRDGRGDGTMRGAKKKTAKKRSAKKKASPRKTTGSRATRSGRRR